MVSLKTRNRKHKRVNLSKHKSKISSLTNKIYNLQDELDKEMRAMVRKCKHPKDQIREYASTPPWLICIDCGLAEEIWGVGPWHLSNAHYNHMPFPRISIAKFCELRTISYSQREIVHYSIHVKFHGQPKDMSKCNSCQRTDD